MVKKKTTTRKKQEKVIGTCGECKNCTYVTEFHTLSIQGKPTLGTCPYWTESRCVLLSLDTCNKFIKRDI